MDAAHFVKNWRDLKAELVGAFMGDYGHAEVAGKVEAMGLTAAQRTQLRDVLDAALRARCTRFSSGWMALQASAETSRPSEFMTRTETYSQREASLKKKPGRSSTAAAERWIRLGGLQHAARSRRSSPSPVPCNLSQTWFKC